MDLQLENQVDERLPAETAQAGSGGEQGQNNAAKKGWEVGIFFTFYGLNISHRTRSKRLQISPVGNPAMPMPAPTVMGVMPGMT